MTQRDEKLNITYRCLAQRDEKLIFYRCSMAQRNVQKQEE